MRALSLATISDPRRWTRMRSEGFAHGWLGSAWVWFQLRSADLIEDDARVRRYVRTRLMAASRRPGSNQHYVGQMLGSAAAPTVAALGAAFDDSFLPVLEATTNRWMASCKLSPHVDLMYGKAGALLACAEIDALVPGAIPASFASALHAQVLAGLHAFLAPQTPAFLGMAHGVAGQLLALEAAQYMWGLRLLKRDRARALTTLQRNRLDHGARMSFWPSEKNTAHVDIHGWCHGGPGIGIAALHCARMSGDATYDEIAARALAGCRYSPLVPASFCCGYVGRMQSLLEGFRITGRKSWRTLALEQAKQLDALTFESRYKDTFHLGRLGVTYARLRCEHPLALPLPGLGAFSVQSR